MRVRGRASKGWLDRAGSVARVLAAAALASSLSGCGGGGGSPSGPTAAAPVRQQLGQGTFTLADSDVAVRQTGGVDFYTVEITTSVTGTLEAIADWTFGSNDLDVYLFRGRCDPNQIIAGACGNPFVQSESVSAKPERLSSAGLAPGSYTFVITSNFGNSAESGSWQVYLTH